MAAMDSDHHPTTIGSDDSEPVRLFYLAAEFRRAAIWGIFGCLLIPVVALAVEAMVLQRGLVSRILIVGVLIGGLAVWLSQYLLARIRVDSGGVSRRILWWWDLWPWDLFSEGRIRLGFMRHTYEHPDRPWYLRTLQLAFLQQNEAERLDALIRRVWKPPPAGIVPEVLKIQIAWPDRREVELTARGVTVSRKATQTDYRWDEVRTVEILRLEPDRRDFRELRVGLPDQECKLRAWSHQGRECRNWTGASPEELSAFVSRHFERPRLRDFSLHGTPRTLDELEARQASDEATSKESLKVMMWCARLFWAQTAAMFMLFPWPKSLMMVVLTGLLAWAVQWMYGNAAKDVEMRRREFEAQRIALRQHED